MGAGLSLVEEEHDNSQLLNIVPLTLPACKAREAVLQNWGVEKEAMVLPGKGHLHSYTVQAAVFPKVESLGELAYPAPAQIMFV